MFLDEQTFKIIVNHAPLVSVDVFIHRNNQYLLGKRKNNPAKGFFFTPGGRIFKDETINHAIHRIFENELNIQIPIDKLSFLGLFEQFFDHNHFDQSQSCHYINLAYCYNMSQLDSIELKPKTLDVYTDQHSELVWMSKREIISNPLVHPYIQNVFEKDIL